MGRWREYVWVQASGESVTTHLFLVYYISYDLAIVSCMLHIIRYVVNCNKMLLLGIVGDTTRVRGKIKMGVGCSIWVKGWEYWNRRKKNPHTLGLVLAIWMTVTKDEPPQLLLSSEMIKQGHSPPVRGRRIFTVFERWQKVIEVDPVYHWDKIEYGRKVMLGQQSR